MMVHSTELLESVFFFFYSWHCKYIYIYIYILAMQAERKLPVIMVWGQAQFNFQDNFIWGGQFIDD